MSNHKPKQPWRPEVLVVWEHLNAHALIAAYALAHTLHALWILGIRFPPGLRLAIRLHVVPGEWVQASGEDFGALMGMLIVLLVMMLIAAFVRSEKRKKNIKIDKTTAIIAMIAVGCGVYLAMTGLWYWATSGLRHHEEGLVVTVLATTNLIALGTVSIVEARQAVKHLATDPAPDRRAPKNPGSRFGQP